MKFNYLISLLLLLACPSIFAQNTHNIGLFTQLNTQQSGSPGIAVRYQWQFSPSFAVESQYLSSGDIKIKKNLSNIVGDQSILSIGSLFLKQYSPTLAIKFSGGVNYVLSSSHDYFVESSSLSPYLKISLEYKVNRHFTIEAGQSSYFQSEQLGNNHNFFIGFNYLLPFTKANIKKSAPTVQSMVTSNKQIAIKLPNTYTHQLKPPQTQWVLQIAAYTHKANAEKRLAQLKQKSIFNQYHILHFDNYYRIVSKPYLNHDDVISQHKQLLQRYGVTNLVKQLP
ncbi:SPOR domain-containing protein [Thalassotalea piscium]